MGSIPIQRETESRLSVPLPARPVARTGARTTLSGNPLAPGAARRFVRAALAEWTESGEPAAAGFTDRFADDAVILVSELVTNAVVHAGTDVGLRCVLEYPDGRAEAYGAEGAAAYAIEGAVTAAALDLAAGGPSAAMVPTASMDPTAPMDPMDPMDPMAHVGPTAPVDLTGLADPSDITGPTLLLEVTDQHPARAVHGERPAAALPGPDLEYGRGLQLVSRLSASWGITYRTGAKAVWARLPVDGARSGEEIEAYAGRQALQRGLRVAEILAPSGHRSRDTGDWINRGALTFLAEASDLLAGQLDEDMVAALAGQLLVPRLADWCAIWLDSEGHGSGRPGRSTGSGAGPGAPPRLARVWHHSENRIEELRRVLEKEPPRHQGPPHGGPMPVPWPGESGADHSGTALAYRLVAGGRGLGTLLVGRSGLLRFPDEVTGLLEDFSRRVALAIGAARQYTRQATISRVLQRGLLPTSVAEVPGVETALVYEPRDKGLAGGDFYDVFPAGDGRWCFALGDVCGNGPEAAVVTGLARPWLRLLAREGHGVAEALDRLNQALLDDAAEAAGAATRVGGGIPGVTGIPGVPGTAGLSGLSGLSGFPVSSGPADDGSPSRFLSLLYGELVPTDAGVRCTLASAGHPLPLLLRPSGEVRAVAEPQVLLGVLDTPGYRSESFLFGPGETLLCVTDGVTERRSGSRQLDDGDGLAAALADCAGLTAARVAERIRRVVHEFSEVPPDDDLALLVLQAVR